MATAAATSRRGSWFSRITQGGLVGSVRRHEGRTVDIGEMRGATWQPRAWDYWGMLGELHYPTSQLARHITRLDWDVEINGRALDADSELGSKPETDQFFDLVADGIGRIEAARLLALNFQVAGEGWYVWRGEERGWTVMSVVDPELRGTLQNQEFTRIQFKVTDPRDQRYAESAFMSVVGPAEELLTLEALSRAQSRARISQAGIFLRPKEVQFDEDSDPFGADLEEAMTAPIADERSPSALMPLDVEVPADMIEKFRHIVFERPYDENLPERVERATRRIAIALDIPPELLLGVADLNHWTAWLTQEDTHRSHVEPLAFRVAEVFEVAGEYYLPGSTVRVRPNATALLARRSSIRDAMDATRLGAVGLRYVRDAIGASDEDAPTAEDLELIMMLRGAQREREPVAAQPVESGPPDTEGSPLDDADVPAEEGAPAEPAPVAAALPSTEDELEQMGEALAELDQQLRDTLYGALDVAAISSRRRLGAKVRTAVRGTAEHELIRDTDNTNVTAVLTVARCEQLVDLEDALRSGFADLEAMWRRLLARARRRLQRITGVPMDDPRWLDAEDRSVVFLLDGMVEWTVDQLDRTVAEMTDAPQDLARETLARAGGSS